VVSSALGQQLDQLAPMDTSIFVNYDLGLETSVPTTSELVIATVNAEGFLSAFAALPRFEYFRAQDGSTFVNVGALLRPEDIYRGRSQGRSSLRLYASLTGLREPSVDRYVTNEKSPFWHDLAAEPEPGGIIDLWTGLALPPGKYLVTVAVEDTLTGSLGRGSASIDVPEFPADRLSLSTLVLASSLSESSDRLGVIARSSGVFRKKEEFGVYYEVYLGEGRGGATRFDVSYRFYGEGPSGPEAIGEPITFRDRNQAAQAWSFPLARWPSGKYRLEVTVTRPDGRTAASSASFEVTD
jgi:hypothetical protein